MDTPRVACVVAAGALLAGAGHLRAADAVMTLRLAGGGTPPLSVEVWRWSTDVERAPLRAAVVPLPPAPADAPGAGAAPGAARGGRAAGRGGRGSTAPASQAVRLATAIKAAPTVGFIWGDGPTGFSIKYAWRSALPDGRERIVLVADRRIATAAPDPKAPADAEFTVLEMRVDAKGAGDGRLSHALPVVIETAPILALDGFEAAASPLKVTR